MNGDLRLNMQDSTIKKKRGKSFFNADRIESAQKEDILSNPGFIRGSVFQADINQHAYNGADSKKRTPNNANMGFGGGLGIEMFGEDEVVPSMSVPSS